MFSILLLTSLILSGISGTSLEGHYSRCLTPSTNISTGNPGGCLHPTSYFRQFISHTQGPTANNTFLQQYQVITDYFKPGGPILFIQGDEAPFSCIEGFAAYEYARELGAMIVAIEHRYFGISNPFGLKSSQSFTWSVDDMKALTLDNVLADSAVLLRWLRQVTPGARDSRVIAFGGSYGGFLVPMLRIRYPSIFYGVIASGGVFRLDTSPRPDAPISYANWISNVYADLSFDAATIIRSGFDEVRSLMEKANFEALKTALNLCTRPNARNETSMLTYAIFRAYVSNSQFAQAAPVYGLPAHSLDALIEETLAAPSSLAALNASIASSLKFDAGRSCLAWYSGKDLTNQSEGVAESRPYSYMICTYYPYPHTTVAHDTIFGVVSEREYTNLSVNVNTRECQTLFNMSAKTGDETYRKELGLGQEQLMHEERMFFVEAQYDWVSTLGLHSWAASGNRNKSRWWFMAEASHTEDLIRSTKYDSKPLRDTRTAELAYIKAWLDTRK